MQAELSTTPMSGKIEKKIRQLYNKGLRHELDELKRYMSQIVKPPPRWIPVRLWIFMQRRFLNLD